MTYEQISAGLDDLRRRVGALESQQKAQFLLARIVYGAVGAEMERYVFCSHSDLDG